MGKYVNARQLARVFMLKNKDKLRLSTIINEIEIAEKGLNRTVAAVDIVLCKDCAYRYTEYCNAKHERADMDYCSAGIRQERNDT